MHQAERELQAYTHCEKMTLENSILGFPSSSSLLELRRQWLEEVQRAQTLQLIMCVKGRSLKNC